MKSRHWHTRMTIDVINGLPRTDFVKALGWIFEGSPWVALRAWERRPFATVDRLHGAMVDAVASATRDEQLTLLSAHPDLGANSKMSEASVGEQAGAGLDRLTPKEFEMIKDLNDRYREKFGFPFILAVEGATTGEILKSLVRRFPYTHESEFRVALEQVYRIAHFRLSRQVLDGTAGS